VVSDYLIRSMICMKRYRIALAYLSTLPLSSPTDLARQLLYVANTSETMDISPRSLAAYEGALNQLLRSVSSSLPLRRR